jgi:hypothetical protein
MLLTVRAHLLLEITDLRHGRVLSTCAQEVAERVEGDSPVAAFVEEGEGFLEVGRLRLFLRHHVRIAAFVLRALRVRWMSKNDRCVEQVECRLAMHSRLRAQRQVR